MKNRIISIEKPVSMIACCLNHYPLLVLVALSILFSGSTLIQGENTQTTDDQRQKRLDLLEKLENGTKLTDEDIRSSFGGNVSRKYLSLPPFPEFPDFDILHNGEGNEIVSGEEMREIHERFSESFGEFRKAMESFRNSEEFMNFKEEFKKWSTEFKKEMDKVEEELIRSARDGKGKTEVRINYM